MGESSQHPVFFELPSLDSEQASSIKRYFYIRRKSGGGDCSGVTHIREHVYCVSFNDREAQQRVLQRHKHELNFQGALLVLTVRDSVDPTSKSVSPKLDIPPLQVQQSIPAPTPPSSGEEYELRLDPYLIRFLKECPKAGKELEEKLASVACSAQLYPEDEKVLVRTVVQPGAMHDVRNWKVEVKKLFDGYLCQYEFDPHKVKALLQPCSSQTTDQVKVYSEIGMAVVVGEHSQVKARLVKAEDVQQWSRLSEKQTSTRRLGEAKLRLLWTEIEQSLGRDFPGVKVTQGDAGQLVLEGSAEELVKAGDLISDKEKLVFEKTVSDISPLLIAFLRKAYGGPGVLGDFLGVGDKVEVELRASELRFFSFSADKLNGTEKKLKEKFRELKVDVSHCSAVPSQLREKLKSKTDEMNQGQYRAQVVFGSDSTVCFLGHTEEVEELNETVAQLILDQAIIEGKVILPFPELEHKLSELLQLHKFDCAEVTFSPFTSSSGPMVMLEGPSSKVTEVRNRLGPFLDSLVQDRVIIDLPGASRYFKSPAGRENILNVTHSHKCLVHLEGQPHTAGENLASGARLTKGCEVVASYSLCDGLQVLVCQGDITELEADALVNAANEDLDHCGGVAAALSKAGGPQVQKESKALVKQTGKISTGDVVVTTGGNLKCKKLLHAVGPIRGKEGGRERILLEKTVHSALNLAEMMEFESIAMPCISSGVFGVPVDVCSDAIVAAVKGFGSQGGRSLSRIILIDNRREVVRAMQGACDRHLQRISTGNTAPSEFGFSMDAAAQDTARGATAGAPGNGVHVEIIQGTIETQQTDALLSPMDGHDPLSTRVGHALCNAVGPQLNAKFHQQAGGATLPGDAVLVEGLPQLQSKGVFFLNLVKWDNNQNGTAVQVLRQGIRKVFAHCQERGFRSVTLPVLGTGAVLGFPHSVVSRVVLEEVGALEQNQTRRTSVLVRIVIHPNDKESSKAFQSAQETLHLRGFTNDANPDQASFYRHVSLTNDEVTATLGTVTLQMVFGDIIHEQTDVIVNTTDFSNHQSGVSKALLTAAGHTVQTELAKVGIPADNMCTTGPGLLNCREIIHASFKSDPQTIRKNCKKILKLCENKGYHSAAFPAINTGAAGMDSVKACKAMLDGMTSAITELKPSSLTMIRIVILQQAVFQAFRSELENRFGQTANRHLTLREKAKQKLKKWQHKYSKTSCTTSAAQGKNFISFKPSPAVIRVISCGPGTIGTIKRDLESILQKQLVEKKVDLSRLDAMELEAVLAKVKVLEISLEYSRCQSSEGMNANRAGNTRTGARDQPGSGGELYVLKGLKEDVLSVVEFTNRAIHKALCQDLQDKEEAMLALSVQWSFKDENEVWQELSLHDNFLVEEAYMNKEVFVDLTMPSGKKLKVNLTRRQVTDCQSGATYELKRCDSETVLELPAHWEPMHDEIIKKVELKPNSKEYIDIAQGFLNTATYNICKIERVQNFYLWNAYSLCKKRILAKNGPADVGEKRLYHGTSAQSCNCIETDRFDRSFAGEHGSLFGKGVYFAVNAKYSADNYSPADASGLKRLYVASVLTGRYTVGNPELKAPPPRNSDPADRFNSVVDNRQPPSMFVIFHDDQAYPEYLITFK